MQINTKKYMRQFIDKKTGFLRDGCYLWFWTPQYGLIVSDREAAVGSTHAELFEAMGIPTSAFDAQVRGELICDSSMDHDVIFRYSSVRYELYDEVIQSVAAKWQRGERSIWVLDLETD